MLQKLFYAFCYEYKKNTCDMHRHFFASLCLFWLSFSTIFAHSLFQGLPHTAFDGSGFLSDPLFEGQVALKPAAHHHTLMESRYTAR